MQTTLRIGELEIDVLNREVRAGASVIHLTGLEQSLLCLLAADPRRVIGRNEILDALWGVDFVAERNVVDRHVRALRAKLHNDRRRPAFLATVPGGGVIHDRGRRRGRRVGRWQPTGEQLAANGVHLHQRSSHAVGIPQSGTIAPSPGHDRVRG